MDEIRYHENRRSNSCYFGNLLGLSLKIDCVKFRYSNSERDSEGAPNTREVSNSELRRSS